MVRRRTTSRIYNGHRLEGRIVRSKWEAPAAAAGLQRVWEETKVRGNCDRSEGAAEECHASDDGES